MADSRFVKLISILRMLALSAFASGCASEQNGLVLEPVGPMPAHTMLQSSTNGILVVFSAYEVGANFNNRDPRGQEYSDYTILTAAGDRLRRIHNDTDTMLQDPATVELPPGNYRVVARANGYGTITIPICIQASRHTVLHLEGGGMWPNEADFNQTNAVRLPNGVIIGWRASQGETLQSEGK